MILRHLAASVFGFCMVLQQHIYMQKVFRIALDFGYFVHYVGDVGLYMLIVSLCVCGRTIN